MQIHGKILRRTSRSKEKLLNDLSLQQILSLPTETRHKLYDSLTKIYVELEKELEAHPQPCTGCGECCHFEKAGHRLYGSSLELAFLKEKHPSPTLHEEDRCPHQIEKSCSVRHERLIGCRTFFRLHSQGETEAVEELYEKFLGKLKKLYRESELEWEYRDLMSLYPRG